MKNNTLVVFRNMSELRKGEGCFKKRDAITVPRINYFENIEWNKFDKVIGVNLGTSIKTRLILECSLNGIECEIIDKRSFEIEVNKLEKKKEKEKNMTLSQILDNAKEERKQNYNIAKEELKKYSDTLGITLNRPGYLTNAPMFSAILNNEKIKFKNLGFKNNCICDFVESLELGVDNICKIEKYENKMILYITEDDYLQVRSIVLD